MEVPASYEVQNTSETRGRRGYARPNPRGRRGISSREVPRTVCYVFCEAVKEKNTQARVIDDVCWFEQQLVRAIRHHSARSAAQGPLIDFTFDNSLHTMVGKGSTTLTPEEHIAKLDARFHTMLTSLDCHKNTVARLGELGVTTASSLTTLVDDRAELRVFLKDALGLDPGVGFECTLAQGKVIQAWEQATKRLEVENKRDAERISANLPPQLTAEDVRAAQDDELEGQREAHGDGPGPRDVHLRDRHQTLRGPEAQRL